MDLETIINEAQELNRHLQIAIKDTRDAKAEANNTAASNRKFKESLDSFAKELEEREKAVKDIENAVDLFNQAKSAKAEADLQSAKISQEWEELKVAKAKHASECQAERNDIEQKRELYNRGAEENKITKEKLDEKLKKLKELKV